MVTLVVIILIVVTVARYLAKALSHAGEAKRRDRRAAVQARLQAAAERFGSLGGTAPTAETGSDTGHLADPPGAWAPASPTTDPPGAWAPASPTTDPPGAWAPASPTTDPPGAWAPHVPAAGFPPAPAASTAESAAESAMDTTLDGAIPVIGEGSASPLAVGPQVVPLTPALREQVVELMRQNYEVMAVRLLCDELGVGILDAQQTVRAAAGLPTPY